tara:strand:+ start:1671 stop:2582 length:912 start_codon:yes stop_codon:yes gene_type:complete
MAYNFIGLVNEVNRRLNEVELTTSNFATATGYYNLSKDAVNSAIRHIHQEEYEWPWNHVEQSEILVAGEVRYSVPYDSKTINYNTFRIKRDDLITATASVNGATTSSTSVTLDGNSGTITAGMTVTGGNISGSVTVSTVTDQNNIVLSAAQTFADNTSLSFSKGLGVETKKLRILSYEEYLDKHADFEYNSSTGIRSVPTHVTRAPSKEIIFTPTPDKAYEVIYEYYTVGVEMLLSTDVPAIPEEYKHIIVDGAMYYVYIFRGDTQAAQLSQDKFSSGIKYMRSLNINRTEYIRDTRIIRAHY